MWSFCKSYWHHADCRNIVSTTLLIVFYYLTEKYWKNTSLHCRCCLMFVLNSFFPPICVKEAGKMCCILNYWPNHTKDKNLVVLPSKPVTILGKVRVFPAEITGRASHCKMAAWIESWTPPDLSHWEWAGHYNAPTKWLIPPPVDSLT